MRIETIIPVSLQRKVIKAMVTAHPYEEVAYDVYPLDNKGETLGLGKIGYLQEEMTLGQFAEHVKQSLDVKGARVVGKLDDKVRKVAVLGGDGNKYINQAKFKGADVYVTGDMYYHVAHDAMMLGLNIVDPGHNVEKVMKQGVQKQLQEKSGCKRNSMYTFMLRSYIQIHLYLYKKIKTVAHASNGFYYCSFFTFTRGNIFCNGTFRTLSHVAGFIGLYCSKKAITSFVIGVGVEAPAVTATFSTPCSHSN